MKEDPESYSLGRGATPGLAKAHRQKAGPFTFQPGSPRPQPQVAVDHVEPEQTPEPVKEAELPICHGCRKPFTTLRRAQYLDKLDKAKYFCTTGCAIVFAVETVKAS